MLNKAYWLCGEPEENTLYEVFLMSKIGSENVRRSCGLFAFRDQAIRAAEEIITTWNGRGLYSLAIEEVKTKVVWRSKDDEIKQQ